MNEPIARDLPPGAEMLLYQTEDGITRVEVRFQGATAWLSQAGMAELFQTTPQNITQHISSIYGSGELMEPATCKSYLQVRQEGSRRVQRNIKHYSLAVILAVGYRVQSHRGTQFRQWATARLEEYLMKGFTLDDERLKQGGGGNYFDELLERIRDIRSSERVFWRKILDIYATSIDYAPTTEASQAFFRTVQNKLHWAAHGHTAAELIAERADASKPNMGLTTFAGEVPRKADVMVAKNYLDPAEVAALNKIVSAYLEFAELQASNRRPMYMADWIEKLDGFLRLSEREVLTSADASPGASADASSGQSAGSIPGSATGSAMGSAMGSITREDAEAKVALEYERFTRARHALPPPAPVDEHFDAVVRQVAVLEKTHRASPLRAEPPAAAAEAKK